MDGEVRDPREEPTTAVFLNKYSFSLYSKYILIPACKHGYYLVTKELLLKQLEAAT